MYIAQLYIAEKEFDGDVLPPEGTVESYCNKYELGGAKLTALEKVAIDYAIQKGMFTVATAGNRG